MELFTDLSRKISDELFRCEEFSTSTLPTLKGTCKKDTILTDYINNLKAAAAEIDSCSTKLTLVRKTSSSGKAEEFNEICNEFIHRVRFLVDEVTSSTAFEIGKPLFMLIISGTKGILINCRDLARQLSDSHLERVEM